MSRRKAKSGKLSVFKGREAKLNKAIFHILALKSPLTIYDIHKQIQTQRGLREVKYATVNKRVRSLEESRYIHRSGTKRTKAGFEAPVYELAVKSYLAMLLNAINVEELLWKADEIKGQMVLATILDILILSS